MTIEKNGKIYKATENVSSWTVSREIGRVSVSYNIPKEDCPTFDALKSYVIENDLF
ncbi:MAG: hypothetical protein SPL13_00705 [Clostridia bacterium]|nr:hypothetical protein [Clostridia bacterium]